jgi:hypothetical protein
MFLAVKMEKMVGRHRDWQLFFFAKTILQKDLEIGQRIQFGTDRC